MANRIVMLPFLWLNSADLTVLSNSVFFLISEIVTEHLALVCAEEVILKGNVEKKYYSSVQRSWTKINSISAEARCLFIY